MEDFAKIHQIITAIILTNKVVYININSFTQIANFLVPIIKLKIAYQPLFKKRSGYKRNHKGQCQI